MAESKRMDVHAKCCLFYMAVCATCLFLFDGVIEPDVKVHNDFYCAFLVDRDAPPELAHYAAKVAVFCLVPLQSFSFLLRRLRGKWEMNDSLSAVVLTLGGAVPLAASLVQVVAPLCGENVKAVESARDDAAMLMSFHRGIHMVMLLAFALVIALRLDPGVPPKKPEGTKAD